MVGWFGCGGWVSEKTAILCHVAPRVPYTKHFQERDRHLEREIQTFSNFTKSLFTRKAFLIISNNKLASLERYIFNVKYKNSFNKCILCKEKYLFAQCQKSIHAWNFLQIEIKTYFYIKHADSRKKEFYFEDK